jgi:hypothetical protein
MAETEVIPMSLVGEQERAQIDMLVSTAKRYPRDLERAVESMIKAACRDQETAESCAYHLSRDGHSIEGPSVHLARIVVARYGNIRFGGRVISNNGRVITGQGFCHDCEQNNFAALEIERRITDKRGRTYSEDMQVVTGQAAVAIALRNAILSVIPSDVWKPVMEAARKVAVGDIKTLSQRRTRALRRFATIGVNEAMILSLFNYDNAEQITVDDVQKLFGIFTAIKDETTTIEDQFGVKENGTVKPNIAKQLKAEKQEKPAAAVEVTSDFNAYDEVRKRLQNDDISETTFFKVIRMYGMARDPQGLPYSVAQLEDGVMKLENVEQKHIATVLKNWRNVIEDSKRDDLG